MSARLRPFFPFYGSKWRSVPMYPPPAHSFVIEPFCGSAGYATYHNPPRVGLVDADPVIVGVWSYLIRATRREILALPDLEVGEDVQSCLSLSQEAQWLIGFWLNRGSAVPKRRRTAYSARTDKAQLNWGQRARERIATQVEQIRHWRVVCASYADVPNLEATWFIDPPYVDRGRYYRINDVDHDAVGVWCRERRGLAIACENLGASWLPFESLATVKSSRGVSREVVWISEGAVERQLALAV